MSVIENILYGFASGLTEFLPISSSGHQTLLRYLFGGSARLSLQDLLVHIGVLMSILIACRDYLSRLRWEQRTATAVRRNKSRRIDGKNDFELRLLRSAVAPMLAATVLLNIFVKLLLFHFLLTMDEPCLLLHQFYLAHKMNITLLVYWLIKQ